MDTGEIEGDLSKFSMVELEIIKASPSYSSSNNGMGNLFRYACYVSYASDETDARAAATDELEVGDIIGIIDHSDLVGPDYSYNHRIRRMELPAKYFLVTNDDGLQEIPNIKFGEHCRDTVIRIPIKVCEAVGGVPRWSHRRGVSPRIHPIEFYGDNVRYMHRILEKDRLKEALVADERSLVNWSFILELTPEQYEVARSLPEDQNGIRSWPSLEMNPNGSLLSKDRVRELATEVKFKLSPPPLEPSIVEEALGDTLPYEVRKLIVDHGQERTATLLLED
jgi:hypothetical protein